MTKAAECAALFRPTLAAFPQSAAWSRDAASTYSSPGRSPGAAIIASATRPALARIARSIASAVSGWSAR